MGAVVSGVDGIIVYHACGAHDLHPYECAGETCIHCNGERTEHHDPDTCRMCNWEEDSDDPVVELRDMLRVARERVAQLEAQVAESPVVRRNAVRSAVDAERHRVYLLLTQRATEAATTGDTAAARTLLQAATAMLEEQGGR